MCPFDFSKGGFSFAVAMGKWTHPPRKPPVRGSLAPAAPAASAPPAEGEGRLWELQRLRMQQLMRQMEETPILGPQAPDLGGEKNTCPVAKGDFGGNRTEWAVCCSKVFLMFGSEWRFRQRTEWAVLVRSSKAFSCFLMVRSVACS